MAGKSYVVEGFCFKTEAEAENAKNELKGVKYMKERIDYINMSSALSTYNMINEKGLFKTPVGISFLYDVRKNIIENGILEEDVPPVKLETSDKKSKTKIYTGQNEESIYKSRFINMIIVNVVLIITLILFAIIANNSENLNIINYHNRIEEEYQDRENNLSQWSQELKLKEKELNERESELNAQ